MTEDEMKDAMLAIGSVRHREREDIRQLCDRIGYGNVMHTASELWAEKARREGFDGSNHLVGTCATFAVTCPHHDDDFPGWRDENGHCDWCCGCGWATKKVVDAMLREKAGA
jgi:hypothetical protein